MQGLLWGVTLVAIAGTVLNVYRRREGFALWTVTNVAIVARNVQLGEWPLAALFAVYTVLAVWGFFAWKETDR